MSALILLRHGESMWNAKNLFTGWVDIPLSAKGIDEALAAGDEIAGQPIDVIFCSTLMRAQQTAMLAMSKHSSGQVPIMQPNDKLIKERSGIYSDASLAGSIPVYTDWHLNERYYGELQGADKQETREKYGDEQVKIWRRSYDVPPPNGESLEMTAERTLPYLESHIVPQLEAGKNVLVAAHGNSLRSIIMAIEGLSKEQVLSLELPTGVPQHYQFAGGTYTKS